MLETYLAGAVCDFDSKYKGAVAVLQIGLLLKAGYWFQHFEVIMMLVIYDIRDIQLAWGKEENDTLIVVVFVNLYLLSRCGLYNWILKARHLTVVMYE